MFGRAYEAQCRATKLTPSSEPHENQRLALFALTLGSFCIGTSEFASTGIIQLYAADLGIDIPTATNAVTRDVLDGTNQNDQFTNAAVNDAMDGHAGADTFIIDTGEIDDDRLLIINGGSDVDVIRFVGLDVYNLNKHSINGIEKLELASADVSVVLDVEDIGGFKITEIHGSTGAQSVTIRGRVIDLSSFAFSDWDNADLVSLAGINGKSNSLTGTDLKDKLSGTGNSDDVMTGGLGADILTGGGGDDRFRYFAGAEAAGGESISGGQGADEIELFNVGNIDFSAASISGVETLDFGNGINTAVFDILGSFIAVNGGSGTDSLIVGGGAVNTDLSDVSFTSWMNGVDAVTVIGTVFDDDIKGSSQADTIDGKSGADRMTGGKGDDIYRVDNAGDFVNESAASGLDDRVIAVASYTLTTGASIELLTTNSSSGTAAISLTGNALAQEIAGNAGQNTLNDGGLGKADVMRGFGGDDTYRIFNSGDVIIEASSQGTADRVTTSVDYTLGKGVFIELFSTNGSTGTSAIALTGNEIVQSITGNAGDNRLEGNGGSDTLRGLGGAHSFAFASARTTSTLSLTSTSPTIVSCSPTRFSPSWRRERCQPPPSGQTPPVSPRTPTTILSTRPTLASCSTTPTGTARAPRSSSPCLRVIRALRQPTLS
jgi:Ca2+-binding RTX toxin-like protein